MLDSSIPIISLNPYKYFVDYYPPFYREAQRGKRLLGLTSSKWQTAEIQAESISKLHDFSTGGMGGGHGRQGSWRLCGSLLGLFKNLQKSSKLVAQRNYRNKEPRLPPL